MLAKPLTYSLFSIQRPWFQTVLQSVLFGLFVGVAWWVIPRWGAVGSAAALLGTGLVALVALAVYVHRTILSNDGLRTETPG